MRKKFIWILIIIGTLLLSIAFVRIDSFQSNKEVLAVSNETEDNPIKRIGENINTDWALDAINKIF